MDVETNDVMLGSTSKQPSVSCTTILLSRGMRDSWEEARKHHPSKALPLTPQAVRRGYCIPKDDWAFLGMIHHPDPSLASCTKTKDSQKGVLVLQAHDNVMDHVAYLHSVIQATAHAQRPVVHTAQSMSQ